MTLFESTSLGKLKLANRIVMAPLTRCRATNNIPNDLMEKYYAQRATAGLIITEGTSPSPNGAGYARIPGLFNTAQTVGWKKVTDAVHAQGGKIFLQIMHTGRASHPANMAQGAKILAPSPIALSGKIWTDAQGLQPYPVPAEMTEEEIKNTIDEYVTCAGLAMEAGFDGIELHSANGYLMEQFLNPATNQRNDIYGGTAQNRMRFVLEIAQQCADKIGAERVGIRISPYGVFNDTGAFEGIDAFYAELSEKLSALGLVYIHIVDHSARGAPIVSPEVKAIIRKNFKGTYILSGNYDARSAEMDLANGKGDLVAFGRPFIANPNLVAKMKNNIALTEPDPSTFYSQGEKGYSDYPE